MCGAARLRSEHRPCDQHSAHHVAGKAKARSGKKTAAAIVRSRGTSAKSAPGSGSGPARSKLRSRLRLPRNFTESVAVCRSNFDSRSRPLRRRCAPHVALRQCPLSTAISLHAQRTREMSCSLPCYQFYVSSRRKFSVGFGDVMGAPDSQGFCGLIDPPWFSLDLSISPIGV